MQLKAKEGITLLYFHYKNRRVINIKSVLEETSENNPHSSTKEDHMMNNQSKLVVVELWIIEVNCLQSVCVK